MEIQSLTNLAKNGITYDLYSEVIIDNITYGLYQFICTDRHQMRLDLVCYDIYQNQDNVDVLSVINSIINVFTVDIDDIILYVEDKNIDLVRSDASVTAALVAAVASANTGKSNQIDPTRLNDKANQKQLEKAKTLIPPNIIQQSTGNLQLQPGAIILKPNL